MAKSIALICAAGIGSRMQAQIPKQYLQLEYQGKQQTILEITLNKFLSNPEIDRVIVALNREDSFFAQLGFGASEELFDGKGYLYSTNNPKLFYCQGFGERRHSVFSMLTACIQLGLQENWQFDSEPIYTLIHDAVRVGIRSQDITKSIQVAREQLTPLNDIFELIHQACPIVDRDSCSTKQVELCNEVLESLYSQLLRYPTNQLDLRIDKNLEHLNLNLDQFYIENLQAMARKVTGVVLPYQAVIDTLKYRSSQNKISFNQRCIDRSNIVQAQTPQVVDLVYYYYLLTNLLVTSQDQEFIQALSNSQQRCFLHPLAVFKRIASLQQLNTYSLAQALIAQRMTAQEALTYLTDDSSLLDYFEHRIALLEVGQHNLKITVPQDLALASFYLAQES